MKRPRDWPRSLTVRELGEKDDPDQLSPCGWGNRTDGVILP